ncbi:alpha,alpha-trehalase TreF [Sphingomonas sp. ac-8]|uniref:alpha,alpha-trehalase TreF n=1 Tax=Sphingomonas sp. ac-8 TaxID=3242977 RepID=UPI003A81059C
MKHPIRSLATLAAAVLLAGAAPGPQTPADLYSPLFEAVQRGRVFDDGKAFVDAVPHQPPAEILAAYRAERPATPEALRAFVLRRFTVPGVNDAARTDLRAHVRQLWPALTRPPKQPEPGSSALPLPERYVVPGGRFREIYYWDSYFTMLGLRADGEQPLVEAMLADFTALVERYGHIPNGTRTYYLSRSQPPFFALMLDLSENKDPVLARRRLAALRTEHGYWMHGRGCLDARGACERVVRMPDGSLLNRYWDDRDTPRDESWAEDVATAREAAPRPAVEVQRHLRAGAESGWDFSSRWLRDPQQLATIHTTDIVPVDLNSLLWTMERRIAERCAALADQPCARSFTRAAAARRKAIDRYLWQPRARRYADWDRSTGKPTPVLSAATLFPLFAGHASPAQARGFAATVCAQLLAPGGLRTTTLRTGQQWDAPNGWAPLQWVAIGGLAATDPALARDIARRWIGTVAAAYTETGKMLEKYDIEERKPGGGGEYPLQDGFGWTNGVTSALLERYPELGAAAGEAREAR